VVEPTPQVAPVAPPTTAAGQAPGTVAGVAAAAAQQTEEEEQRRDCSKRLAKYRGAGLTPSAIVRREGISVSSHYLWWLACAIAGDARVTPRPGSTPTVAVALVCERGQSRFKTYASFNLLRDSHIVASSARSFLGAGHWIPPEGGVHAEQNILNHVAGSGEIVGVAASRCICPGCVGGLSTLQLASPRGGTAVPTCNLDGTPALGDARGWCQQGQSPIPYEQQF
jgi:hypothetical protein